MIFGFFRSVAEPVDHRGDRMDAAQPVVEALLARHVSLLSTADASAGLLHSMCRWFRLSGAMRRMEWARAHDPTSGPSRLTAGVFCEVRASVRSSSARTFGRASVASRGEFVRLLFVCSKNRLRSPTAETVFSHYPGVEVASAGTNGDAETVVSSDLLDWADIVFVMEKRHRDFVSAKFGSAAKDKRIVVLGIPDRYGYMDPELVRLLEMKVRPYLADAHSH